MNKLKTENSDETFPQGLQETYQELSKDQEPLGEDFERIWDENIDTLYEE